MPIQVELKFMLEDIFFFSGVLKLLQINLRIIAEVEQLFLLKWFCRRSLKYRPAAVAYLRVPLHWCFLG